MCYIIDYCILTSLFYSIFRERMTAKECLQHAWITGSTSLSDRLSSHTESVSEEQGTIKTESPDTILDHSRLDNERKTLTDSTDTLSSLSQETTQNSSMVTSESKSSVSSNFSNMLSSSESPSDNNTHIELTRENDLETLEVVNQQESAVDMDTKSESHSNMDISFTKEDFEKDTSICEKNEDTICENERMSEHDSCLVNEDTEMRNRSLTDSDSSFVERLNTSNRDMSSSSSSVQIVVKDVTSEVSDMELTSPTVSELGLFGVNASNTEVQENSTKECNSSDNVGEDVLSDAQNNLKVSENPYKRGMCNDTELSPVVTPSNQSEEEFQYEFISVSKRVRNIEETLSPQKSPQISPKSPRSPRISRLQRRSNHNTPKSPF